MLFLHETGHAFGGLWDEYDHRLETRLTDTNDPDAQKVLKDSIEYFKKNLSRNCTLDPDKEYHYAGKVFGRVDKSPCTLSSHYRPSEKSLMNKHLSGRAFNIVSCGYLLKAIKKGGTARSYFPECAAMPGIIPVGQ